MSEPLNLHEYEARAQERLERMVYDYYAGGAGDESTVSDNLCPWDRIRLVPRVLVDVSHIDPATTVLGRPVAFPVLAAPCAFNRLAHDEGERAVARAATAAGTIQILSTVSTVSMEDVAAAAPEGRRWFQLYCYKDRGVTRALVERAAAAGYEALCLTVDVPVAARRERDIRNRFHLPPGIQLANMTDLAPDRMDEREDQSALEQHVRGLWDRSLTWDIVDWLASLSPMPVVVKGVLHPDDARLAVEHGCKAVIVSNHGGRQLDGAIATCDALPAVVDAVGGRADVLVDGGVRRGTDVLKALALGADAVLVGRPYLWGLAVDGEAGVARVLALLREEFEQAMALVGKTKTADIDRAILVS